MIDETRFKERIEVDRPRVATVVPTVAMPEATTTIEYRPVVVKRASWGAIFAGMFASMAIQTLLTVLGLAIGLSVVSPADSSETAQTVGIGAGIWWVVTGIISLFIGGWIAGRLAGIPRYVDATLHGIAMWAAATVLSAVLVSTVSGALLGGALGALGMNANQQQADASGQPSGRENAGFRSRENARFPGDGTEVSQAAKDVARENEQVRTFVRDRLGSLRSADVDPQELREDDGLVESISEAIVPGADPDAHDNAVEELADATKMNRSDAERTLSTWRSEFTAQASASTGSSAQERAEARQTIDQTRKGMAGASWWTFFALLLGVCAAALGGYLATPRDMVSVTVADNHR